MKASTTNKALKKLFRTAAPAIFWLGLWQLAAALVDQELFIPYPIHVLSRLFALMGTARFWQFTGTTLLRILTGAALGVAAGLAAAVATTFSRVGDALLSPFLRVVRAAPVVSFIILVILWTGADRVPVVICAMMVTPVIWENTRAGLRPDGELLEMARAYGMGLFRRFRYIYAPRVAPHLTSAVLSSIGLAWKSGVAAEVLCVPRRAIGSELHNSKLYLNVTDLFAWTLVVIILSIALESAVKWAFSRGKGEAG